MLHITAHSGCDGTPDNSLEFVRHALSTGADALEVDVRKTEDGSLAISHDPIPSGSDRPLLSEVFALIADSNMRINCDLKEPDLENAVIDLAETQGLSQRLIFSGSVSLPLVQSHPDIHSRVEIYINIEELIPDLYDRIRKCDSFSEADVPPELIAETVEGCRAYGFRVVNVYYELCIPAFLKGMRDAGIGVSAWTVNDPETARRLAQSGSIENITSRRPGAVRQALEA